MCLKCDRAKEVCGRSHIYDADEYDHSWIRCEETHKLFHLMKKKDKSKVTSKEMTEVEKFRKQYPTQQARMNYYAEAFHLTRKRREEEGGSE